VAIEQPLKLSHRYNHVAVPKILQNGILLYFVLVDDAVTFAHNGVMDNAGQCCVAGSRTFVHEKIYDQFVAKSRQLAEERQAVTGDPFDPKTLQGPQVLLFILSLDMFAKGRKRH
jgi:hypothetical protein